MSVLQDSQREIFSPTRKADNAVVDSVTQNAVTLANKQTVRQPPGTKSAIASPWNPAAPADVVASVPQETFTTIKNVLHRE